MTKYSLYIDESGQAGISKVRTEVSSGASPYMTLGAVLVREVDKDKITSKLKTIKDQIGKNHLHCSEMTHTQKTFFSREIAKEELVFFGVISKKSTLGWYKNMISSDPTKYFNKCGQYLLERVGKFVGENGISKDDVDIIFEEGLFNYAKFRSFISICQDSPRHENTKHLRNLCISKMLDSKKSKEELLQIADLVSHSLYKAVDKTPSNHNIPEPRYLHELQKRFYCNPEGKEVTTHGLMPIHSLGELSLDKDIRNIIDNFKGQMLLP